HERLANECGADGIWEVRAIDKWRKTFQYCISDQPALSIWRYRDYIRSTTSIPNKPNPSLSVLAVSKHNLNRLIRNSSVSALRTGQFSKNSEYRLASS